MVTRFFINESNGILAFTLDRGLAEPFGAQPFEDHLTPPSSRTGAASTTSRSPMASGKTAPIEAKLHLCGDRLFESLFQSGAARA